MRKSPACFAKSCRSVQSVGVDQRGNFSQNIAFAQTCARAQCPVLPTLQGSGVPRCGAAASRRCAPLLSAPRTSAGVLRGLRALLVGVPPAQRRCVCAPRRRPGWVRPAVRAVQARRCLRVAFLPGSFLASFPPPPRRPRSPPAGLPPDRCLRRGAAFGPASFAGPWVSPCRAIPSHGRRKTANRAFPSPVRRIPAPAGRSKGVSMGIFGQNVGSQH